MNEAPKGFIPLQANGASPGFIVNVKHIVSVVQYESEEVDPAWQRASDAAMERYRNHEVANFPYVYTQSPLMRKTGGYHVRVSWAAPAPNTARINNCSLVQFIAKMVEALEEINE
jgi:hypothetical protein